MTNWYNLVVRCICSECDPVTCEKYTSVTLSLQVAPLESDKKSTNYQTKPILKISFPASQWAGQYSLYDVYSLHIEDNGNIGLENQRDQLERQSEPQPEQ